MEPVRDMFSAVFFVAIGLLIQPALLLQYWLPIVVITLAVVVGKVLTCSFGAFIAGNDQRTSLRVGMGLAQIGEFSFIIAQLGLTLKVTSDFLYPVAVTVSVLTTLHALSHPELGHVCELVRAQRPAQCDHVAGCLHALGRRDDDQPLRHAAGRFIRKWSWQIALNMLLVAGIFIAALYLRERRPELFGRVPVPQEWLDAVLWAGALLASMPLLIASYRKLQALAMLAGEAAAQNLRHHPARGGVKNLVTTSVSIAGVVIICVILLVLSAALLPSWKIFVVLGVLVAGLTALLWRSFVKIYSKAQISLRATLEQPAVFTERRHPSLAGLLTNASLCVVSVTEGSWAAGKLIRELNLRGETGVTIVGVERAGVTTVNPSPDEEIAAGTQLLLLGQPRQLEKARALFGGAADEE